MSLRGAPRPRLIVDFDKPGSPLTRTETRCDYLLVAEVKNQPGWVTLLELKKGRLDAGKVVSQLKAGSRAAEELVPRTMEVNFRPAVASGGNKSEREKLRDKKNRVKFHEAVEYVRLISCGDPLTKALDT